MLAGLSIYLVQTHSFEELFLNLEVVAIALRKIAFPYFTASTFFSSSILSTLNPKISPNT